MPGRVGAQVSTPKRVLQITPSASAGQITDIKDLGYLNRVVPPDTLQVQALIEYMSRKLHGVKGKKVNIGAIDSTYGKDLTKAFEEAWRDKGGEVGQTATYRADATTVAPQGDQLGQGKPDAWVFFDFTDTYGRRRPGAAQGQEVGLEAEQDVRHRLAREPAPAERRAAGVRRPQRGRDLGSRERQGREGLRRRVQADGRSEPPDLRRAGVRRGRALLPRRGRRGQHERCGHEGRAARPSRQRPGRKYTWLELDQAVRALENGTDIDYEGVSGPIEMNDAGDARAGVYDVYRYQEGQLETSDQIAIPLRTGGV